jgi:hypothetical protein
MLEKPQQLSQLVKKIKPVVVQLAFLFTIVINTGSTNEVDNS